MSQNASYTNDDVAVFDGFDQVFRAARPLSCEVRNEAKLMDHPLESGALVTDHKVHQPIEVTLSCVLNPENYRDVYAEIRQLFLEGKLLTVQCRAATYENMAIQAMPHDESPDMYDTVPVELRLREVHVFSAQFVPLPAASVQNKTQASTVQSGEKQPQGGGSWLASWYPGK